MANATNATNPPTLSPADLNTTINHEPRIHALTGKDGCNSLGSGSVRTSKNTKSGSRPDSLRLFSCLDSVQADPLRREGGGYKTRKGKKPARSLTLGSSSGSYPPATSAVVRSHSGGVSNACQEGFTMTDTGHDGYALPAGLSASDINTTINGEPRVHDLRLALALGFKRPADIRPLIDRHMEALKHFGEVFRTARKTSPKGGRPSTEYWLTKKQAVFLSIKAETEQATDVAIQVVQVFDAVTSGRMPAPAPLSDDKRRLLEALDALIEGEVRHRLGGRVARSMAVMMKVLCDEGGGDA